MNPDDYQPNHAIGVPSIAADLPAIVKRAETGDIFEIIKDEKPVAVLIGHTEYMALLDELAACQGVTR